MNREIISQGVDSISARYVQEAADYIPKKKQYGRFRKSFMKNMAVAAIFLCVLVCGAIILSPSRDGVVTVYAYGTDEEITAAGVVIGTGTISDTGEMSGKPLMFYLTGEDIATVRFSCRKQIIYFTDWTEKRDGYGNAQNFTVVYGGDESEYYYLTIDWVPNATIRELTDNADSSIASLPDELREDIVVLEITFENGKTATKAVTVSLQDDGTFFASFDDYEIKDSDDFVNRPDSETVPMDILYEERTASSLTAEQIEDAKQAALAYYKGTIFSVNSIEYLEGKLPYGDNEGGCNFTVNVSKGGVVQEPDRTISLQLDQDGWKVVNEGY